MNALRRGWRSIGVQEKLHILIQGTLIVLFFALTEWVVDRFEMQIDRTAESRAEETADGLINGMNMLMLTGKVSDPAIRQLLLRKMAQSRGIIELRIIRGQSVIDQFGPGLSEEQARDEMDREVLTSGKVLFHRLRMPDGRMALRVVVPFIAQHNFRGTDCLACHNTQAGGVNGAASVIIDLTEEDRELAEIRDWLWIGHIAVQLLLLVIITLYVRVIIVRNITRPIQKLNHAMSEIRNDMDLSKRADVDPYNPDVGRMARNFNIMVSRLEDATTRLHLFGKMFENSSEAIAITDAERNILAVNPAFERITGYGQEEVLGKNPKILSSGKQTPEFYQSMWQSLNDTGQWAGEIWNRRKNGDVFPEWLSIGVVKNARGEVINYISMFSDITRRKENEARIEFLAHYDALTKLPNRTLFADRLRQALLLDGRNGRKTALLFLDLDRFKAVNDTYGHQVGDLLLQSVAERLRSCVRSMDTICRQGGDEFLILLPALHGVEDAEMVARKVVEAMSLPHRLNNSELHITFSIGVSVCPDDAQDDETLIMHADDAMYLAKEKGRNNYQLYR